MLVARLLKLSTAWKFPLHGPHNYVDWSWELLACCSARAFSLSHQTPLPYVFLNTAVVFSSKSRSGYELNPDLLSEVDFCRLCGFIFTDKWRKKIKVSLRKCLKVVWRAINAQCVTLTLSVSTTPSLHFRSPCSLHDFWNFLQRENFRCTGHTTTSIDRRNCWLVAVHAPSCFRTKLLSKLLSLKAYSSWPYEFCRSW